MTRPWKRRRRAAQQELQRVRSGYDAALEDSGTVLFQQVTREVDAHHVSTSVAGLLGWTPESFLVPGTLRELVHADDLRAFRSVVPVGPILPPDPPPGVEAPDFDVPPAVAPSPVATEPVVRLRTADGGWRHVMVRRTPGPPDAPVRGALIDVTVGTPHRLRTGRFAEVVEASRDAVLVMAFGDASDPTSLHIRAANARARRLFRLDDMPTPTGGADGGTPLDAVFTNGSAQLLRSALFDVAHTGESLTAQRLTFGEVPGTHLDLRVDRLRDGTLGVTIVDVSDAVAVEDRLRHQATHDGLTGLPNRREFEARLTAALSSLAELATTHRSATVHLPSPGGAHPLGHVVAPRPGPVLGVAVVDLAALRDINATHGHGVGDRVLVEVADRLADESVGAEVVGRTGGGEFALITPAATTEDDVLARVELLRRLLDEPVDADGHLLGLGAAVGHAVAPADGDDARGLLRAADTSLQQAKADALPGLSGGAPSRGIALLTALRQGLANRELELRFQPLVELRTGRVNKVEAQLRWQRDEDGAHLPQEFLELAERSGLIQPLTRWMLGEAARAATLLDRPGHPTVVGVNLSLRNLHQHELLSFVELLVQSGELDPRLVEIELPETELMDDPVTARDVLTRLAGMGLRVVVDEFGSGYTSVSTLAGLDISGVKIDRSFISTLADVPGDVAVVRSTVHLAHELGLGVAAEGVADAASLAVLAELGCDHAQGVHLSGPVALDDLARRVTDLESALAGWVATVDAPDSPVGR